MQTHRSTEDNFKERHRSLANLLAKDFMLGKGFQIGNHQETEMKLCNIFQSLGVPEHDWNRGRDQFYEDLAEFAHRAVRRLFENCLTPTQLCRGLESHLALGIN